MKRKKVILSAVFLMFFGLSGIKAQQAITASGGTASDSGGSISFSVGQLVCSTMSGTNGSVNQGVIQVYEFRTGIADTKDNLFCHAYPNPTTDFLTLEVGNLEKSILSYQLIDVNGKFVVNRKVENNVTIIAMGNLKPSIYFLKVVQGDKVVKIFKVIKN